MKELIQKTREYLDYVERHYNNVQKAWQEIQDKCGTVKDGSFRFLYDDFVYFNIDNNIKNHDKSKLSKEEFVQYRQFFYPTSYEIKDKDLMNKAWENHLKENDHHWQTWTERYKNNNYASEIFLIENICDWMAMGYEFGDTAKEYYENNKEKINLPDWAIELMYKIFDKVYS